MGKYVPEEPPVEYLILNELRLINAKLEEQIVLMNANLAGALRTEKVYTDITEAYKTTLPKDAIATAWVGKD